MLTPKQQAFCDNYIVSHNATNAAIKAGYSKKTAYSVASENLRKPEIKKYLELHSKELHTSKIATATEILEFLTDTVRNTTHGLKDRLKAAQMLGDHFALYDAIRTVQSNEKSALDKLCETIAKASQK